jgi:hypothetical protein
MEHTHSLPNDLCQATHEIHPWIYVFLPVVVQQQLLEAQLIFAIWLGELLLVILGQLP